MEEQYIEILLETYKAFRAFCQEHQISYYACGGTMIGAVRHKGRIPWDDDIDVYMLRPEYERFMALKKELEGTDYEIQDPTTPNYYCAMAKFSHRHSTVWEIENVPCVLGVYIDVFVLDYAEGTYEQVRKQRKAFSWNIDRFCVSAIQRPMSDISALLRQGNLPRACWFLYQKFVIRNFRWYYRRRILKKSTKTSGDWLVAFTGVMYDKDIFRAEWFRDKVTVPFEDSEIELPIGYHEFLTQFFGDYMTPPPVEQRATHHLRYFMDLSRRITTEEIQDRMSMEDKKKKKLFEM